MNREAPLLLRRLREDSYLRTGLLTLAVGRVRGFLEVSDLLVPCWVAIARLAYADADAHGREKDRACEDEIARVQRSFPPCSLAQGRLNGPM